LKAYFSLNNTTKEYISNTVNNTATEATYGTYSGKTGIACYGSSFNPLSKQYIINYNVPGFTLTASAGVSISLWFFGGVLSDSSYPCLFNLFMPYSDTWDGIGYAITVFNKGFGMSCVNNIDKGYACYAYNFDLILSNDKWYSLIMTFDPTNKIIAYLNGKSVDMFKITKSDANINALDITSSKNQFNIGSSFLFDKNFYGFISKVAIYNQTLSSSDVTSLFNAG